MSDGFIVGFYLGLLMSLMVAVSALAIAFLEMYEP